MNRSIYPGMGVLRGEKHPHARLTEDDVRLIRRLVAGGETQASVARRFGISVHHVASIHRGYAWRHVA